MTATILYIEDDADNMRLIELVVQAENHQMIAAVDGQEGMLLAQKHRPQLILVDFNLPDVRGYELIRQLRAWDTAVPIIIITADVLKYDHQQAVAAGGSDYITKPVSIAKLRTLLRHYLPPA